MSVPMSFRPTDTLWWQVMDTTLHDSVKMFQFAGEEQAN